MLFAIISTDKPNHLQTRMDNRPEHLAYLNSLGDRLKFAGPFLGGDEKPVGTLAVVEAETLDAAKTIAADDPYAVAGLFEQVEIRRWNWTVKNPDAA
ncbi:YciI-like protein [Jiella sonneratiae]|uniref:YciI family protein n=1 Tax=Jiella sonneratiae TaxID=2816856 RepID=A0ABS3J5D5_9HYPH|nr:YciI-like protein [Jiella sonneratiae]MBO0904877.1 YciI family protein [Jiella sonneratiae]